MSSLTRVIASLLILAAPLASSAEARTTAADRARIASEIKQRITRMFEAFNAHDAAKVQALVLENDAPDLVLMNHGQPETHGIAPDMAAAMAQVNDLQSKAIISDITVDVAQDGDMAVLHAHYDYTLTDPATKAPVREIGNWIAVYVRQLDGRMAMKWDIAADLPPMR